MTTHPKTGKTEIVRLSGATPDAKGLGDLGFKEPSRPRGATQHGPAAPCSAGRRAREAPRHQVTPNRPRF